VQEEETYYDAMKREMAERAAKTKAALDALDPATRVAMEASGKRLAVGQAVGGMRAEV